MSYNDDDELYEEDIEVAAKSAEHLQDVIRIERRELVAEIAADPYGNEHILAVAFRVAGEFVTDQLANNNTADVVQVEFSYQQRLYKVSAEVTE